MIFLTRNFAINNIINNDIKKKNTVYNKIVPDFMDTLYVYHSSNLFYVQNNNFQRTVINSGCSRRATEYSCAILEPACGPDGIRLPPCKSFCEGAYCVFFFVSYATCIVAPQSTTLYSREKAIVALPTSRRQTRSRGRH